jgi:hypothetical protein
MKEEDISPKKDKKTGRNSARERDFDLLLLRSIDDAFETLGTDSKVVIYHYLESQGIIKKDIPRQIDVFSDALFSLFGIGAKFLEILIMKNIQTQVNSLEKWTGPSWFSPNLTLGIYVEAKRLHYKDATNIEYSVDVGKLVGCKKSLQSVRPAKRNKRSLKRTD